MQHLQKGIQIFKWNMDAPLKEHRIWLSAGTLSAISTGNIHYCPQAFLPKEPWRIPTVEELTLLQTNQPPIDRTNCVTLLRIPDNILVHFKKIGLTFLRTREDVWQFSKQEGYNIALNQLIDYLSPFVLSREKLKINTLASLKAGLPTVTFDYSRKCYIGLHLDSWDRLPLKERHLSTNRICINMGNENRFLLFINRTLRDLFTIIYGDIDIDHFEQHYGVREVKATFMTQNPLYPVVKLRIAPGEAYIAPTENMIHDGCTTEQKGIDVCLIMHGYFGIPGF